MLIERQGERLPDWLDAVRQDDLPSLHSLAAGSTASARPSSLAWNSGVVEGHANRIELLKRRMFGRPASNSSADARCCCDGAWPPQLSQNPSFGR
ncbi:hypothetical protein [Streptomyces sp. NPDC059262]|uniref:hypothetical protein n=1 Tax=Streptomyces sp. NPDC059262 TaxID=3346797 RepID=UPI0036A6A091